jgi:hypothetical protein
MNRYYLLMDYTVPVFTDYGNGNVSMTGPLQGSAEDKREFYREHPHTPCPKTRCILDFEPGIRLYVAYHDVDVGQFVIRSRSRKMAYELATLLRALFSLFYGWQLDDRTGHYFLQEMKRLPQPSWDEQRMLAELQELNYGIFDDFVHKLRRGYHVMHDAYDKVPSFINRTWGNRDIVEALDHALESRFLFFGFMVGSYYTCHYARDRELVPRWEMEKRYFENRYRYETAFVAAFKGIERFFGVNQIRKNNIDTILSKKSDLGIAPDTEYTRYHEIFSGHTKRVRYRELICHFLDLRNIVAAHGNRNPPERAKLIEDNVFEIQLFLMELLSKAIYSNETNTTS